MISTKKGIELEKRIEELEEQIELLKIDSKTDVGSIIQLLKILIRKLENENEKSN